MKILLTNFHTGHGGGHLTYIVALAKGLSLQNDITVATPAGSALLRQVQGLINVDAIPINFRPCIKTYFRDLRHLRRVIRHGRFDIVHVNGSADHRQVMLATWLLWRRPAIVFTKHNDYPTGSPGNRWRARFATRHTIAVSAYVAQLLSTSAYRAVTIVRHGVDTQGACHPDLRTAWHATRRRLLGHDDAGHIVLGSTAGTGAHKGWLHLIDALTHLPPGERSRFSVILAGALPTAEQLAHVQRCRLRDQVHFTGLIENPTEVLGCSDVAFVLSYRETLSYACREAMAAGLPVIVTGTGGLTENVDDGVDGWVVPVADAQAIAAVLRAILENPARVGAMGAAARRKSMAAFGMAEFLDATQAVYALAAARRPARTVAHWRDRAHDAVHAIGMPLRRVVSRLGQTFSSIQHDSEVVTVRPEHPDS
ncbi:glycosyltransferase [Robbsia sp. Bb-Pol-6]|uniref:Glycosyltransferase n=1 Tax=Robbsia betulipollinis TaxID=2981849 RepID=A0ABT3ZKF8_9BURK|nr:glycosyltransferase [Robbsia betulipollinis]MCY0387019.1 glycosyltransferase [Robbsia betulipollinis]